jgi:hypothetical protein
MFNQAQEGRGRTVWVKLEVVTTREVEFCGSKEVLGGRKWRKERKLG